METLEEILKQDKNAKTKLFKKGEVIQNKGQYSPHTYFVSKGLLRSYIIDSKGKQHIFMFACEGWIMADLESIEFEHPTELFIDCLEDTEVVIFDRNWMTRPDIEADQLLQNIRLLYRRMGVLQKRILMQMSSPAIDRYTHFLETYPQLPNRIPQHMIASYLGITPQALSTIRAQNR